MLIFIRYRGKVLKLTLQLVGAELKFDAKSRRCQTIGNTPLHLCVCVIVPPIALSNSRAGSRCAPCGDRDRASRDPRRSRLDTLYICHKLHYEHTLLPLKIGFMLLQFTISNKLRQAYWKTLPFVISEKINILPYYWQI